MLDFKPNIVHFCGHGEGTDGIAFEDETGSTRLVSAEALAGFFELFADKVECVLLNACYSEVQARAIAQHIDYVIGMKVGIGDTAAIEFAVAFYDALGAGESIKFAYRLACNAIQWTGISEHLTPVLNSKTYSAKRTNRRPANYVLPASGESSTLQKRGQWMLVLSATIDEIDDSLAEAIVAHLQELSGDASLTIKRIESGSVTVFLEGSRDGFEQIETLFTTGQLNDVLGITVREIQWELTAEKKDRVSQPTLAIGLGGTGDKVIRHLKRLAQDLVAGDGTVNLLVVDTAPLSNLVGEESLDPSEYIYIGGYSISPILTNLNRYPAIQAWWPVQDSGEEWKAHAGAVNAGARQSRPIGRLSFFRNYYEFSLHLETKLRIMEASIMKEQLQRAEYAAVSGKLARIYVVSSLCGGTGAGIFLDVAFKLRAELRDQAHITGIFILPSAFLPVLHSRTQKRRVQANAYASLVELDHYMSSSQTVDIEFPGEVARNVSRPFDRVVLVEDWSTGLGDLFQLVANTIYLDATVSPEEASGREDSPAVPQDYGYYLAAVDTDDYTISEHSIEQLKELPIFEKYKYSYHELLELGERLHVYQEWK